jgi:hypothetical protein
LQKNGMKQTKFFFLSESISSYVAHKLVWQTLIFFSDIIEVGKTFVATKREHVWLTSKLWNTEHHPERVRKACEQTLVVRFLWTLTPSHHTCTSQKHQLKLKNE